MYIRKQTRASYPPMTYLEAFKLACKNHGASYDNIVKMVLRDILPVDIRVMLDEEAIAIQAEAEAHN